jgi:hypothetical protein
MALLLITNLVYAYLILVSIPAVMKYSNGLKLFDMMPAGYSPEYCNQLLSTLGSEGRNTYLHTQIPPDLIYPGLFAFTYAVTLLYLMIRLKSSAKGINYLIIFPVMAGISDYLENAGIVVMLKSYPHISSMTAEFSNIVSILKSAFSTITFTLILIFLAILVIRKTSQLKRN